MTSKSAASTRIRRLVEEIPGLMGVNSETPEFIRWRRSTGVAIARIFGEDSRHVGEFYDIRFAPSRVGVDQSVRVRACNRGLGEAGAILESMLEEIQEDWPDDTSPQPIHVTQEMPEQQVSNRVFVVHGRDDGTKNTVARFLEQLHLEAIILHEQPNQNRTIIDKFEKYSQVDFAVILCTPDDVSALASESDKLRPRPRQNVVLEWGFFLGLLGRERVCALLKGDIEIPSDYDGVLYVQMEGSEDWRMKLAIELRSAGMPVDLNRLARS